MSWQYISVESFKIIRDFDIVDIMYYPIYG